MRLHALRVPAKPAASRIEHLCFARVDTGITEGCASRSPDVVTELRPQPNQGRRVTFSLGGDRSDPHHCPRGFNAARPRLNFSNFTSVRKRSVLSAARQLLALLPPVGDVSGALGLQLPQKHLCRLDVMAASIQRRNHPTLKGERPPPLRSNRSICPLPPLQSRLVDFRYLSSQSRRCQGWVLSCAAVSGAGWKLRAHRPDKSIPVNQIFTLAGAMLETRCL